MRNKRLARVPARLQADGRTVSRLALLAALAAGLAPTAAAAEGAATVEEVVVTASKRETALQDLPAAISAVTSDQLDKLGASSFRDIATAVPGLTFVPTSDSTTKIVLRGISTGNNNDAASSGTGLYLDDVPMGSAYGPGGAEINILDLQRVEVLRGPQGTLYGAGSMGGTVRYVTHRPDLSAISGEANAEASVVHGAHNADAVSLDGVLNVPIVRDRLGLRVLAYHQNNEGWIASPTRGDDAVNGVHLWGGRASLMWKPADGWSVTLMGLRQDTHQAGGGYVDVTPAKQPIAGDLTQSVSTIATPSTIKSRIVSLDVEGDLGWATLTSATSYVDFERYQTVDDTGTFPFNLGRALVPGTTSIPEIFWSEDRGYAQELRLASPGQGRLTWVAGLFFQDYQLAANRTVRTNGAAVVPLLDATVIQHRKTYAVFGEGTYDFTPEWSLTFGGRYARIISPFSQRLGGALIGPRLDSANQGKASYFTPKVELTFQPDRQRLFYVLYSEGYRPGGANLQYPAVAVPATFEADTVKNYEIGAKTAWLDGRVTVNVAAFREDFDKLQVVTNKGGLPYYANAGSARSDGVEAEVAARLSEGLSAQASVTWDDAVFTTDAPALAALKGDRIPQIPRWTVAGSLDYQHPLGSVLTGFVHLDGRYVDSSPAGNSVVLKALSLDSYTTLNLRLGLQTDHAQVALFAENLTDERAQLNLFPIVGGPVPPVTSASSLRMTTLKPRTVGVKVGYRF